MPKLQLTDYDLEHGYMLLLRADAGDTLDALGLVMHTDVASIQRYLKHFQQRPAKRQALLKAAREFHPADFA